MDYNLKQKILIARSEDVHADLSTHYFGFVCLSIILTASYAEPQFSLALFLWLTIQTVIAISVFSYLRVDVYGTHQSLTIKKRIGEVIIIAIGVAWGAFPHLLFQHGAATDQNTKTLILGAALCVVCVNAAPLMVLISIRAYIIHITIILLGMAFYCLSIEGYNALMLNSFLALYWVLLVVQNVKLRNMLIETIKVKIESIESKEQALQANQDKSRFISATSHDIRQPLQAIIYLLEHLKREIPEKLKHTVIQLEQSVENMNQLLVGLLEVSKLDSGVVVASRSYVYVPDLLTEIANVYREDASQKGLDLILSTEPCHIYTDPILLNRVVSNLLSNSIKYTNTGEVILRCTTIAEDKVVIKIIDTGIGIPQEAHSEVFKEYYQVDNSDRTRGLGLGLSIVKKLSEILEIELSFESNPQGTRFLLGFKAEDPNSSVVIQEQQKRELEYQREQAREQESVHFDFHKTTIFYVEDNPDVRESLAQNLTHEGCTIIVAESYEAAQTLVDGMSIAPDIILSDFQLPNDFTSVDIAKLLKQKFNTEIPLIVLSGDSSAEAENAHCDILLHKPTRIEVIKYSIVHLLNQN